MEILSIKRPNNGNPTTGLKIYATVKGDSGTEYKIGYFRRPSFRGWMCSCPNFVLSQFGKGGHCKHINLIQDQYGRYGAYVQPSKARITLATFTAGLQVIVPRKTNQFWAGNGVVERTHTDGVVVVRMVSGGMVGETGGFDFDTLKIAPLDGGSVGAQEPGLQPATQGQDSIGQ